MTSMQTSNTQQQPNTYCRLYIARHGESEGNVLGIIQGHADFPLTTTGKSQAAELAAQLAGVAFAAVYSSDLVRAHHTAAAVANQRKLAVATTALLRERHFGKYESAATVESQRKLLELLNEHEKLANTERFNKTLGEGIESDAELVGRCMLFLREVALAYPNKNILVVSHSGMMRAILIHLGYYTYQNFKKIRIPNTAYFTLDSDGIDFFVRETVGFEELQ